MSPPIMSITCSHITWGMCDVIPGCGTVLPKGPESSALLGGQDDTTGHVHQGPSNNKKITSLRRADPIPT